MIYTYYTTYCTVVRLAREKLSTLCCKILSQTRDQPRMEVLPSQSRGPLKWRWASPWEAWGPSTPGTWRWRLISPWGESESPRVVLSSQPGVPRQRWLDPRLKYDTRDVEYVTVEDDDRLWKPDTFIRNDKESSFFLVPSKASFLRVFPDGFVLYSVRWGDISDPLLSVIIMTTISCRIKSKLHCLMDLRNYPFDQQECKIMFASCETDLTSSVVWNYFIFSISSWFQHRRPGVCLEGWGSPNSEHSAAPDWLPSDRKQHKFRPRHCERRHLQHSRGRPQHPEDRLLLCDDSVRPPGHAGVDLPHRSLDPHRQSSQDWDHCPPTDIRLLQGWKYQQRPPVH